MNQKSALRIILEEEVRRAGAISLPRYMDLALYHPVHGYYRTLRDVFGTTGDFYTAEQLQPVFGELLQTFVAEQLSASAQQQSFEVLELGSGRGELRSVMSRWNYRAFDWATAALPERLSGLILANEFFDALPVHRLKRTDFGWIESGVAFKGDQFVFADLCPPAAPLLAYAEEFGKSVPPGGVIEVCQAAAEWMARIGRMLVCGHLLVIDYGYTAEQMVRFPEGTLMSYRHHVATEDILAGPSEQDITAHVNFSFLRRTALSAGFEVVFEGTLGRWATSIWPEPELTLRWTAANLRWRLQWKHLVIGFGEQFRVLLVRTRP